MGQRRNKVFHPIYYASRTLIRGQLSYMVTKKELIVIVFAFDIFRSYPVGTKVTVFTDHLIIKYLIMKKDANKRLIRWVLLLEEFDVEIQERNGVESQVANHFSRLEHEVTRSIIPINDNCSDEHIFECVAKSEVIEILYHCHSSQSWVHLRSSCTATKVLQAKFLLPTLFKDEYAYGKNCDQCQWVGNISKGNEMPLTNIFEVE
ncbi:Transposon Ty3-I Gag-Pol polyprotein [Gossypium australe]|uniref:Transposon Ty3-I Gag-Pol polyprotein n=1 Tax=Gossypium australe TaxID=47621 RepID=A0A5B6WTD5_9ROSI|nr:Transposon Ty3-I Gag-Pol polyprotein [Gossypium australe]